MRKVALIGLLFLLITCLVGTVFAEVLNIDLVELSRDQLTSLTTSIESAIEAYHEPTHDERNSILTTVKEQTQLLLPGCNNFSWPWLDYAYTKDWDLFTLTTSVDYRSTNDTRVSGKLYSEVFTRLCRQ